jgi:hypothetical protein
VIHRTFNIGLTVYVKAGKKDEGSANK